MQLHIKAYQPSNIVQTFTIYYMMAAAGLLLAQAE